jgi:tetratricopeptide (TPR) repeat protein
MNPFLLRGQILADLGRHDEAAQQFVAQIAQAPDDVIAHGLLAISLAVTGQTELAQFHAHETLRLAAHLGWSHFVMGFVLNRANRCSEAQAFAEKAIELQPEVAEYFHLLAAILGSQCKDREAMTAVESCLSLTPNHTNALNLRAWFLRRQAMHREADSAALYALQMHPENAQAHVNYGLSLIVAGNYRKALVQFREAMRLDPSSQSAPGAIVIARSFRAIAIMLGFFVIVAIFLAVLAFSQAAVGCFQVSVVAIAVFMVLLLWRRPWHSFGWHRRMRFR